MLSRSSLGALARREALLLVCLAALGSLAALSQVLTIRWLRVVTVAAFCVVALVRLGIAVRKFALERRRERLERRSRTRCEIGPIENIDPTQVGVEPAAQQTVLAGGALPEYLDRGIDRSLAAAINAARAGTGPWMVIAVGRSKTGKSRSLFEALRRCGASRPLDFVAPVDFKALGILAGPGETTVGQGSDAVLWLDDIEPFLNQGLTLQALALWRERFPNCIVVATYGGKGSDTLGESDGEVITTGGEILRHAREVHVQPTDEHEVLPLRGRIPPRIEASIARHGLAAVLIAGPELERKLALTRGAGEKSCPEGAAIVYAAADWMRCGRTDPIRQEVLRELWPYYLAATVSPSDLDFDTGLKWSLEGVAGTVSLLERVQGGYMPHDYIVQYVAEQSRKRSPCRPAWDAAIEGASDYEASSVGANAFMYGLNGIAHDCFAVASASPIDEVAALAACNLGEISRGRKDDAVALVAFDRVISRFGDSTDPWLGERVANAWFRKAGILAGLERREDALAAYGEAIARFHTLPNRTVLRRAGQALVDKGVLLGRLGRRNQAIEVSKQVVSRFGQADEPGLRETVAQALLNMAAELAAAGRAEEALVAYEDLIGRFNDAEEDRLREQVGQAWIGLGTVLTSLGRNDEAVDAFEQGLSSRHEEAPSAEKARGMLNKAASLRSLDRTEEALNVYDEAITCFELGEDTGLRIWASRALVNKGATLAALGRLDAALATLEAGLSSFAEAGDPEGREEIARWVMEKGSVLGELGRHDQALTAYEEVVALCRGSGEASLRRRAAQGSLEMGLTLFGLGRTDEALAALEEGLPPLEEADDRSLHEIVAKGLLAKGAALARLGRAAEAVAAYDQLRDRFGSADDPKVPSRLWTAVALRGKGALLLELDRDQEALTTLTEALACLGQADDVEARILTVEMLLLVGASLTKLRRYDEALRTFREIVTRVGDTTDDELQRLKGVAAESVSDLTDLLSGRE